MASLKEDVPVAALLVSPHRALEDRSNDDHDVGLEQTFGPAFGPKEHDLIWF